MIHLTDDEARMVREALHGMVEWAVDMENSGDVGHWDIDADKDVIKARQALAMLDAKAGENLCECQGGKLGHDNCAGKPSKGADK